MLIYTFFHIKKDINWPRRSEKNNTRASARKGMPAACMYDYNFFCFAVFFNGDAVDGVVFSKHFVVIYGHVYYT